MERAPTVWPKDRAAQDGEVNEYFCPVCGIELTRSDFDKLEWDYYCPFCSTRQMPSEVRQIRV